MVEKILIILFGKEVVSEEVVSEVAPQTQLLDLKPLILVRIKRIQSLVNLKSKFKFFMQGGLGGGFSGSASNAGKIILYNKKSFCLKYLSILFDLQLHPVRTSTKVVVDSGNF